MNNPEDFLNGRDADLSSPQIMPPDETHNVCETSLKSGHEDGCANKPQPLPSKAEYVSIHQWFEAQVSQTPNAIAVSFQGQTITYHALNQQANQLAHYLKAQGLQPEERVAISMNRCIEMVISFLAVLKAEGAYVPIDPAYPHERRAYKLQDAKVRFILTQQHLVEFLPNHQACVICPDADWQNIASHSTKNLPMLTTPQQLAYVVYTSGSTGKPKGVMITHQGMIHHSQAIIEAFALQASDRVLQFSSISFDILVEEVFPSLVSGAAVILRTEDSISSTRHFLSFIGQEQITVLNLPTAFWHGLVSGIKLLKAHLHPAVRLVVVGGEKASRAIYAEWLQWVGQYPRWLNAYGPTETTVTATIFDPIAEGYDPNKTEVPIGRALPHTKIYILDLTFSPLPEGEVGEMYIGGPGLARGYLNLPEHTANKFVANPFSNQPDARLYRTGDTARYLANGVLEFMGRIDFQIKIRGFRIELLEIEAYLEQYPSVQQGVVLAQEDASGEARIVAYVILRYQKHLELSALRSFLKTKLPEYMIPTAVVVMERFPMMPNGKVDRRAFPAPQTADVLQHGEAVLPIDGLEAQLVKIWERVLNIKPIGTTDHFMDLGGTSLLVAQLADQIDQHLHQSVPLSVLFKAPTIRQLAQFLRQGNVANLNFSLVEIQPQGSKPPLFLFEGASIYYALIPHLGLDQPIYGLIALLKDGVNGPINQVEAIAAYYIDEIMKVQPAGPYYLGGFSFGGIVAFEVAQQLAAQEQKTELLILLDAMLPSAYKPASLYRRLQFHGQKIIKHGTHHVVNRIITKATVWIDKISLFVHNLRRRSSAQTYKRLDLHTADYLSIGETIDQAEKIYAPKSYTGQVVMFRALNSQESESAFLDPDLGWKPYLKDGMTVYDVPGDHLGILSEPNVGIIGKHLRRLLNQVYPVHQKSSSSAEDISMAQIEHL